MRNYNNEGHDVIQKRSMEYLVSNTIEQGSNLTHMLDREDRIDHLALSAMSRGFES